MTCPWPSSPAAPSPQPAPPTSSSCLTANVTSAATPGTRIPARWTSTRLASARTQTTSCYPTSPASPRSARCRTGRTSPLLAVVTGLGKKSLLSLSMRMALHDMYAAHPGYTTRVRLHVRDSNGDVVAAASAATSTLLRRHYLINCTAMPPLLSSPS